MSLEDEISALPGLRGRAIAALEAAEEARLTAENDIVDELREQAYHFIKDALLVDAGTASCALEDASATRLNSNSTSQHPAEARLNVAILVKIDKETLRFHFVKVKAFQLGASDNKEFASETIYDDVLVCEWRSPGSSFYKITDLATLGQMIAEHTR